MLARHALLFAGRTSRQIRSFTHSLKSYRRIPSPQSGVRRYADVRRDEAVSTAGKTTGRVRVFEQPVCLLARLLLVVSLRALQASTFGSFDSHGKTTQECNTLLGKVMHSIRLWSYSVTLLHFRQCITGQEMSAYSGQMRAWAGTRYPRLVTTGMHSRRISSSSFRPSFHVPAPLTGART